MLKIPKGPIRDCCLIEMTKNKALKNWIQMTKPQELLYYTI